MRRKLENREVRKIFNRGASYAVTLPIEIMRELGWKKKQKVYPVVSYAVLLGL